MSSLLSQCPALVEGCHLAILVLGVGAAVAIASNAHLPTAHTSTASHHPHPNRLTPAPETTRTTAAIANPSPSGMTDRAQILPPLEPTWERYRQPPYLALKPPLPDWRDRPPVLEMVLHF